jgi:DNA-binding IclR family transcriptional regulator
MNPKEPSSTKVVKILSYLRQHGPSRNQDIADHFGYTRQRVHQILQDLVAQQVVAQNKNKTYQVAREWQNHTEEVESLTKQLKNCIDELEFRKWESSITS